MNKIKLITVFVLVSVFIVGALFILHGAAKQNDAAGTTDVTGTTNTTAAAQTTSFATSATSATKISPPPLPPPDYITAMQFDRDFYKAKAFIEKNDISEFSGKDKENFAKTMEIYHADGFLINATSSNADEMIFLYLSPRQVSRVDKTETMPGLAYGIYMGEEYYILKVCNAEEERLKKAKEIYGENFETGYFALAGGQLYEPWRSEKFLHSPRNEISVFLARRLALRSDTGLGQIYRPEIGRGICEYTHAAGGA